MDSKILSGCICNYISQKISIESYVNYYSFRVFKHFPDLFFHQQRVSGLSFAIAEEMGLNRSFKNGVLLAAKIHDIGKIKIDPQIINKPGSLTELEFATIKEHPELGSKFLLRHKDGSHLANITCQHHEKVNGAGYPYGLKQESIMLPARIVSVADSFDAIAHKRPYRDAMGHSCAFAEIQQYSGIYYDDIVISALERLLAKQKYSLFLNILFKQPLAALSWIR